nr:discoidin domain-containing protein [Kitasatospora phosalacinea]
MQAFGGGTSSPSPSTSAPASPSPSASASSTCPGSTGNLAQGRPATASGTSQTYGPGNAVDGDANTYWESTNNAFPQWIQVDLGCARNLSRAVLKLPPAGAWATRTQTVTVQGSTDGTTFTTLVGSAGYVFDPATGNTVTVNLPATPTRYLRLTVTGNTGWPAGQLSELQAFTS